MKRRIQVLVGAAIFLSAIAVPAWADEPFVDEGSNTFEGVNPCSGEAHEVTIHFVDRIHVHRDNFVLTSKQTGTTDSGFVMEHSVLRFVDSELVEGTGIFTFVHTDVWRNDATGDAFIVRGVFVLEASTDIARVERFTARCLGS